LKSTINMFEFGNILRFILIILSHKGYINGDIPNASLFLFNDRWPSFFIPFPFSVFFYNVTLLHFYVVKFGAKNLFGIKFTKFKFSI